MWTTEITLCEGCGQEAELLTDGRVAYVNDYEPEWAEVDGLMVAVPCTNIVAVGLSRGERCDHQLLFAGEGTVVSEPVAQVVEGGTPIRR